MVPDESRQRRSRLALAGVPNCVFELRLLEVREAGGLHREISEAEGMVFVHRFNTFLEEGGGEMEKFLRKYSPVA